MALPADLQLTAEQQQAVSEIDRPVRITGGAGTGKTTTLVARYRRLLRRHPASSLLVVCRDRDAAARVLDAVLGHLAGGFDSLPVTTVHGLAFDLVSRHHGPVQLLSGAEQREQVTRLLATEGPQEWPTLGHLLPRRAFAREVSGALLDLQSSLLADTELTARAEAAGELPRWLELMAFASRYRAALAQAGATDSAGLLATASALLGRADVAALERGRFAHVLVDDYHTVSPAGEGLLSRLAQLGAVLTVAVGAGTPPAHFDGVEVGLTQSFRHPLPPLLVPCSHPAVEPEAVAGVLLGARDEGVAWSDMAVLVRRSGGRARGIARALARHGIPVAPLAGPPAAEPTVAAVVDMLRWAGGDAGALDRLIASPVAGLDGAEVRAVRRDAAAQGIPLEEHPRLSDLVELRDDLRARTTQDTPAALAFEVWRRRLGHLVAQSGTGADNRALDALVSFCDSLGRRAERHPDERLGDFLQADPRQADPADTWRSTAGLSGEVATIAAIDRAPGRQWHTVVVAGCVEGELPRVQAPVRLFQRDLLERTGSGGAAGERRGSIEHERRLFAEGCTTATGRLVATAAPEPGVLLSRFVEAWPTREPELPLAPGPELRARTETSGMGPIWPDGRLRLSATRLATYDDCPLRYSYRYVLGARDDPGVRADLGSLVHEVLAAFLDPDAPLGIPRTREALLALGEERWRDDIARYRPQVEEARRDFFAMLEGWWDAEGGQAELAPQVLAVERRFEVDVGPHRLTGAIDRIDRADDGSGIRIVDYKTGKAEPAADQVADDLQLAIYHLAASRDPELARIGPPSQLRLLYLRTMHRFEQDPGPDHERLTEERLRERAAEILAERFAPSVEANCRTCSFQRLCPLHDEGRQLA